MKAAVYVRVSTEMQAEEGFSISAQITELTNYCNKNDIKIFKIYADEGISGQKEDRPQFQQMLKDAEKKLFDIILVHKFDRFARKVELSQRIKRQLRKAGINVVSMTEPVEDSPIGFFTEGILELLGEYYVKNLAQESKKGHVQRAKEGFHNGSVPYGYKIDHTHPALMSINPEQAEVVKSIYDMYLNKGYGCTKIARVLNESGIPSAVGKEWHYFTINRILKNPKYAGYIEYDNQLYEGKQDPIIDKKDIDLVKQYLKDRTWKREYRGANFEKFAMLGLLRCGYCGNVMRVWKYTRKYYGYICNDYMHRDTNSHCKHGNIYRVEVLEQAVIEAIKGYMQAYRTESIQPKANTILLEREKKLEQRLSRLKEGYLAGLFEIEEYKEGRQQIEKELADIKQAPKEEVVKKSASYANLLDHYNNAKTPSEKRNILKEHIQSIDITRDSVNINFSSQM
jgi:site-specific DNA recombinase